MATILVIDDNAHVASILKAILEKQHHEVTETPDGVQALSLLEQRSFDVVITDILMPGKEGLEVIRGVCQKYPHTKIIAISGGGRVEAGCYLDMARDFGADRILQKPFDQQQVIDAVDLLLESRPVEAR